jgi:hypothetical protein
MEPTETVTTEVVETPIVEQAVITENAEPSNVVAEPITEAKPEKTFTQSELDNILTKRLDRERETITKKTAQEARDAVIAEQGHTWNGQPIKTEAEYKQALKDQATYEALQKQGYPAEAINRLIAVERSQEETVAKLSEYESKSKQQKDAQAFFEAFPDAKPEEIPASVWLEVDKGESLVNAYTRHENMTLKQQIAEATKAREIEELNAQNAASSTGSVTGQGAAPITTFFTQKQVKEMSNEETNRNWAAIQQSMKNPKFYD